LSSAWAWLGEPLLPELEEEDPPPGAGAGTAAADDDVDEDDEDEAARVRPRGRICPAVFLRLIGGPLLAVVVELELEPAEPAVPDRDEAAVAGAAPVVLVVLEAGVVLGARAPAVWPPDLDTSATILAALVDGPRWPGGAPPGSGTGALGSEGSVSLTPG
jgi:hypothetical protein